MNELEAEPLGGKLGKNSPRSQQRKASLEEGTSQIGCLLLSFPKVRTEGCSKLQSFHGDV